MNGRSALRVTPGRMKCPRAGCINQRSGRGRFYVKKGYFKTRWNAQWVARYQCRDCGKYFSSHTFRMTYRQKRPDLNEMVFKLYCSSVTQRRMALLLQVNRKTIVRKFLFLALQARRVHEERVRSGKFKIHRAELDEMETFEHTRLKPLSIALAVDPGSTDIVDMRQAQLGYKGPLAGLAFKKYGPRENKSHLAVEKVLSTIALCAERELTILTDKNPSYRRRIKSAIPHAVHVPTRCVIAEIKTDRKNYNDPLFTLNFTCANVRGDLSRMVRRTWVTTKKPERLQAHLDLYIAWRNGYHAQDGYRDVQAA